MTQFDTIYSIVREVPEGCVLTYGQIAEAIKQKAKSTKHRVTPRTVGYALHRNPDPEKIPCHRVVNREGRVADSYAFGGAKAQRRRLVNEGITFIDDKHVDLKACLWQ